MSVEMTGNADGIVTVRITGKLSQPEIARAQPEAIILQPTQGQKSAAGRPGGGGLDLPGSVEQIDSRPAQAANAGSMNIITQKFYARRTAEQLCFKQEQTEITETEKELSVSSVSSVTFC